MIRAQLALAAMLALTALFIGACSAEPAPQFTAEQSQQIAEQFVRSSPTFTYDGMEETLSLTESQTAGCPSCWEFTFAFDSRHAGYGDRTGQVLAQVITPHQVVVSVEEGEVISAIMDGKWDMLRQEMIRE